MSVAVSTDIAAALGLYRAYFIEPLVLMCVLVNLAREQAIIKKCVEVIGCSVVWLSLLCLAQYLTRFGLEFSDAVLGGYRVMGVYNTANAVGLYLAPLVMIFLALGLSALHERKLAIVSGWFAILVAVIGGSALLLSFSRGAWLALGVGGMGLLMQQMRRKELMVGLIVVVLLFLIVPGMRGRFSHFFETSDNPADIVGDTSTNVRWQTWQGTWRLILDRPIMGAGLVGFQELYPRYKLFGHLEDTLHPHMIILNFWVEMGLLGLITFAGLIGIFFWEQRRYAGIHLFRSLHRGIGWAMIVLLVHGLVDVPYFKNDLSCLFWLIIGMQIAVTQTKYLQVNNGFEHT
jgi:O-antigen ligase